MKTKLTIILLAIILSVSSYSQDCEVFEDHPLTSNANGAAAVIAYDFDGDSHIDIISASYLDSTITLWRNDGSENFNPEPITTTAGGVLSLSMANFDGVNNMDFVAAYLFDDTVAWWENDGNGAFTEHIMTTTADGAFSVFAADIDNDEDSDVVAGYFSDDEVAWFENDGSGNFTEETISNLTDGVRSVYASDLNGDGYMDVLSASEWDGKVAWYEFQESSGSFGNPGSNQNIIVTHPDGAWRVTADTINDDNHFDVITNLGVTPTSKTVWFENDGQSSPTFSENPIYTDTDTDWLEPYDIDWDGDIDIISAEWDDGKIVYFRNHLDEGLAWDECVLVEPDPLREWPNRIFVALINDDTCPDIISTWETSNVVSWQELLPNRPCPPIIGLDENQLTDFSVFPIPTSGILHIQSQTPIVQIEIYNVMGQLVMSNTVKDLIDISRVSQGIYFVRVKDANGNFGTRRVVKQ